MTTGCGQMVGRSILLLPVDAERPSAGSWTRQIGSRRLSTAYRRGVALLGRRGLAGRQPDARGQANPVSWTGAAVGSPDFDGGQRCRLPYRRPVVELVGFGVCSLPGLGRRRTGRMAR